MEAWNRGIVKDDAEATMAKLLRANAPRDSVEGRQVHRLLQSRHMTGDGIRRARMLDDWWEGRRTLECARELGGHPLTVGETGPEGAPRFHAEGIEGLTIGPARGANHA
jgi:hypothetical protein